MHCDHCSGRLPLRIKCNTPDVIIIRMSLCGVTICQSGLYILGLQPESHCYLLSSYCKNGIFQKFAKIKILPVRIHSRKRKKETSTTLSFLSFPSTNMSPDFYSAISSSSPCCNMRSHLTRMNRRHHITMTFTSRL